MATWRGRLYGGAGCSSVGYGIVGYGLVGGGGTGRGGLGLGGGGGYLKNCVCGVIVAREFFRNNMLHLRTKTAFLAPRGSPAALRRIHMRKSAPGRMS